MKIGDSVIVLERYSRAVLENEGTVLNITDAYVETLHRRDPLKYPGLGPWGYEWITIKHYGTKNIKE